MNKVRIILTQHGSRHRYFIPKILYQLGVLEKFYTDTSSYSIIGIFVSFLIKRGMLKENPLKGRCIKGIPYSKVKSSDAILLRSKTKNSITGREYNLWKHSVLSKRMISWGVDQCDWVYNMYIENVDFLRYAKSNNKKIISDIYVSPITDDLLIEEQKKFPELDFVTYSKNETDIYKPILKEVFELSDILLCPSEWVADGVRSINPNYESKIKIVPYGSSINNYNVYRSKPIQGRFFFAGYDVLRKGLPYLAKATTILKKQYPEIDVRVAGHYKTKHFDFDLYKDLTFLGKLNKDQMINEFLNADAFILPSLSEGFAGVIIEALTLGVPVICTKNSGVIFENDNGGLNIAPYSSKSIVEAIQQILDDRPYRDLLALNTKKMANNFSVKSWSKRIENIINNL